jgi:hypothetical protein
LFDYTPAQVSQFSLIGSLAGMANGAIGSYYSAQSKASSLSFAADMANLNSQMAEKQAQHALYQGNRQSGQLSMKYGQTKSSQRAAMAANGVDLGTGSASEVLASTDISKEIDMNAINENAVRSAWGFRTQSVNYNNEALIGRATAGSISPFGYGMTSMLGGAGNVATAWYRYAKESNLTNTPATTPIVE